MSPPAFNFIVHLLAIAGRVGIDLRLEDFDALGSRMPLLVNLMPSGQYLMEDFYYAGDDSRAQRRPALRCANG